MIVALVGLVFATLGALFPVRFPSGRRIQFAYANATFAIFLVTGLRDALAVAWIAGAIDVVATMASARRRSVSGSRRDAFVAPTAMTIAILSGEAVARLVDATRPMPIRDASELVELVLVLTVAYVVFVGVKELLARHVGSVPVEVANGPAFDRPSVIYAATVVVSAPLQILAHVAYLDGGVVPWAAAVAWSLLFNVVAALEARSAAEEQRLVSELAVRERLAAIGEVTARVTHQMRHQIGLIGMSLHRIESRVADLDEEHAAFVRAELAKLESAREELRLVLASGSEDRVVTAGDSWSDLVRAAVQTLAPLAQQRSIVVTVDVERAPRGGPRDPEKLGQGWFNLVENAISAARSSVVVRVEATADAIDLLVEDDGPGMTKEVRARAMEPFFTTKDGGSGMGLAIARAVADDEGGELALESREEGGTRARMRLPRTR